MPTTTGAGHGFIWGYATSDSGWGPSFNDIAQTADDLLMCGVIDSTLATPPGSPAQGDRYIVAASPTGAWAGQAGKIAVYYGTTWAFYTPKNGWTVRCAVKGRLDYSGTAWVLILTDAASDGIARARKNAAWVAVVEEAPIDGTSYVRKDGAWVAA